MSIELLIAGVAFLAQVIAWAALPIRAPKRIESEK